MSFRRIEDATEKCGRKKSKKAIGPSKCVTKEGISGGSKRSRGRDGKGLEEVEVGIQVKIRERM
jgi:hypothetical protein